ncbi:MAG TPA: hypothetical protein PLS55_08770 [Thermogutta sp.]|nr:hypothetical protein [Thermogutta sp.]
MLPIDAVPRQTEGFRWDAKTRITGQGQQQFPFEGRRYIDDALDDLGGDIMPTFPIDLTPFHDIIKWVSTDLFPSHGVAIERAGPDQVFGRRGLGQSLLFLASFRKKPSLVVLHVAHRDRIEGSRFAEETHKIRHRQADGMAAFRITISLHESRRRFAKHGAFHSIKQSALHKLLNETTINLFQPFLGLWVRREIPFPRRHKILDDRQHSPGHPF